MGDGGMEYNFNSIQNDSLFYLYGINRLKHSDFSQNFYDKIVRRYIHVYIRGINLCELLVTGTSLDFKLSLDFTL